MSVPAPVPVLLATTDFVSAVTLRHAKPSPALPPILGYKYFHSAVSLGDVLAQAQADIDAHLTALALQPPPVDPILNPAVPPPNYGGIPGNPAVLSDLASNLIGVGQSLYGFPAAGPTQFSRDNLAPDIYFVHVLGPAPVIPESHWYAVVVWNDAGPSTIITTEVLHRQASFPQVIGIEARETEIDVTFDQPVRSPTGRDGEGFTFRVNGITAYADDAFFVGLNVLRFTMAGVISDRDTVIVSYDDTKGDLTNSIASHDVISFLDNVATNLSSHSALMAAVIALNKIDPERITLIFSLPVTSADHSVGLSFTVNGEPVPFTSAGPGQDPRKIEIVFPNSFSYADTILMSYDALVGDWQSLGYPQISIVDRDVSNASRIGTPNSDYPLSSVVREPLEPRNGSVFAKLGIDLNFIDRLLVHRYGPVTIDCGGTFGATSVNPQGVFLPQDLRRLTTGMEIEKEFRVPGLPDQASIAGAEWLEVMTERVGLALGILRTQDRNVVLGNRTARQV
jgi:hypothetical protein